MTAMEFHGKGIKFNKFYIQIILLVAFLSSKTSVKLQLCYVLRFIVAESIFTETHINNDELRTFPPLILPKNP